MNAAAAIECRTGLATQGSLVSEGVFAQGPSSCDSSMGYIKVNKTLEPLSGERFLQMLRSPDLQATAAVVKPVRPSISDST